VVHSPAPPRSAQASRHAWSVLVTRRLAMGDEILSSPTLILLRDGGEVTHLDGLIGGHDVEEVVDAHRPPTFARSPQ
jgi:hypothetical protein